MQGCFKYLGRGGSCKSGSARQSVGTQSPLCISAGGRLSAAVSRVGLPCVL